MCQHEKRPANETTEPLSFVTVCKLELDGKAIVSQSRSRRDYALYLDEIPRFSSFFGPSFVLLQRILTKLSRSVKKKLNRRRSCVQSSLRSVCTNDLSQDSPTQSSSSVKTLNMFI